VTKAGAKPETDSDPMRLVAAVREGSYQFHGMTDATMNHGEGGNSFTGQVHGTILCVAGPAGCLFLEVREADTLDWWDCWPVARLRIVLQGIYRRTKTRFDGRISITESGVSVFRSLRVERMGAAIAAISQTSFTKAAPDRTHCRRLRASLAYAQIAEIMIGGCTVTSTMS